MNGKATRPSDATDHTKYWHRLDEEINVIDRDRKARAAKLADMAAIHARVLRKEPVFPEGDGDER